MPSLGSDMEAGTLIEWLVEPGQTVDAGEAVAVVETHKGAIDVESFHAGTIHRLVGTLDEKVPVGTLLALLLEDGEAAPDEAEIQALLEAERAPAEVAESTPPAPSTEASAPVQAPRDVVPSSERARVSPRARRRARELGVALESLKGTGLGGAITGEDVERAVAAKEDPNLGLRRTIAATMARSNRDIPHYYLEHTIDLEPALAWLEDRNASRPVTERVLPAALLLRATALALAKHGALNGYWLDERPQLVESVHLGVVIALRGGGVVAPAIHDAAQLSLDELMAALRDLVGRAKARRLRSSEMSDATATVSNLGDRGIEAVFPVIFPPQLAIVGFGAVLTRPWVVDGAVVPRRIVRASLAGDHRATDGNMGARLLATLEALLLDPEQL